MRYVFAVKYNLVNVAPPEFLRPDVSSLPISPLSPPQCQTCLKALERHDRNGTGKNFFAVILMYVAYA